MATSLNANKVNAKNFTPTEGQKAIPVYSEKFNDLVDIVETNGNTRFTTDGAQASGLTVTEYGNEIDHRTVVAGTFVTAAGVIGAGALPGSALAFGKKIYDFPEGGIRVSNAILDLEVEASLSSTAADIGLGSVVATGATAALGASSTYEDIVDGSSDGGVTAGTAGDPGIYQRVAAAETDAAAFDGCTTAKDMFLNVAAAWEATGTFILRGTISFNWSYLGDYTAP